MGFIAPNVELIVTEESLQFHNALGVGTVAVHSTPLDVQQARRAKRSEAVECTDVCHGMLHVVNVTP